MLVELEASSCLYAACVFTATSDCEWHESVTLGVTIRVVSNIVVQGRFQLDFESYGV